MTAFFNTHHASVGAWASLTFGSDTSGVSIDHQDPIRKESGAMLFGRRKRTYQTAIWGI